MRSIFIKKKTLYFLTAILLIGLASATLQIGGTPALIPGGISINTPVPITNFSSFTNYSTVANFSHFANSSTYWGNIRNPSSFVPSIKIWQNSPGSGNSITVSASSNNILFADFLSGQTWTLSRNSADDFLIFPVNEGNNVTVESNLKLYDPFGTPNLNVTGNISSDRIIRAVNFIGEGSQITNFNVSNNTFLNGNLNSLGNATFSGDITAAGIINGSYINAISTQPYLIATMTDQTSFAGTEACDSTSCDFLERTGTSNGGTEPGFYQLIAANDFSLWTNISERMKIDGAGNANIYANTSITGNLNITGNVTINNAIVLNSSDEYISSNSTCVSIGAGTTKVLVCR